VKNGRKKQRHEKNRVVKAFITDGPATKGPKDRVSQVEAVNTVHVRN
jgi:hypothetical protein